MHGPPPFLGSCCYRVAVLPSLSLPHPTYVLYRSTNQHAAIGFTICGGFLLRPLPPSANTPSAKEEEEEAAILIFLRVKQQFKL
jgi:hypothetical protein